MPIGYRSKKQAQRRQVARKEPAELVRSASVVADEMRAIREDMLAYEAAYKRLSKELLDVLNVEGRSNEGIFHKRVRSTLTVSNPGVAMDWATANGCMKIDTSKAQTIFRRRLIDPATSGFKVKETQYIGIGSDREEEDAGIAIDLS